VTAISGTTGAEAYLTLGLVDVLGRAIVAGEFPRCVLPIQPELARCFCVSRSGVREVVKLLAAKALVVTRPHQGTVIERHTARNLFDPLVVRRIVEGRPSPDILYQLCEFSMSIEPIASPATA